VTTPLSLAKHTRTPLTPESAEGKLGKGGNSAEQLCNMGGVQHLSTSTFSQAFVKHCQEICLLIYTVRHSQFCRNLWVYTFQFVIFFSPLRYLHLPFYWFNGTKISCVCNTHHITLKSYFNQNYVCVHECKQTENLKINRKKLYLCKANVLFWKETFTSSISLSKSSVVLKEEKQNPKQCEDNKKLKSNITLLTCSQHV